MRLSDQGVASVRSGRSFVSESLDHPVQAARSYFKDHQRLTLINEACDRTYKILMQNSRRLDYEWNDKSEGWIAQSMLPPTGLLGRFYRGQVLQARAYENAFGYVYRRLTERHFFDQAEEQCLFGRDKQGRANEGWVVARLVVTKPPAFLIFTLIAAILDDAWACRRPPESLNLRELAQLSGYSSKTKPTKLRTSWLDKSYVPLGLLTYRQKTPHDQLAITPGVLAERVCMRVYKPLIEHWSPKLGLGHES